MIDLMNLKCNQYGGSTAAANYYAAFSTAVSDTDDDIIIMDAGDDRFEDAADYSVYEIAAWFLNKESMTHKKLQKLCYYAQAWSYALRNGRLIRSDFQAWVHGPVSPALYERFKQFGYDVIVQKGDYDCEIQPADVEFLEDVWETYGGKDGNALEALTHHELPWIEARRGYAPDEICTVVISPASMRDYYRSIYAGA